MSETVGGSRRRDRGTRDRRSRRGASAPDRWRSRCARAARRGASPGGPSWRRRRRATCASTCASTAYPRRRGDPPAGGLRREELGDDRAADVGVLVVAEEIMNSPGVARGEDTRVLDHRLRVASIEGAEVVRPLRLGELGAVDEILRDDEVSPSESRAADSKIDAMRSKSSTLPCMSVATKRRPDRANEPLEARPRRLPQTARKREERALRREIAVTARRPTTTWCVNSCAVPERQRLIFSKYPAWRPRDRALGSAPMRRTLSLHGGRRRRTTKPNLTVSRVGVTVPKRMSLARPARCSRTEPSSS